MFKKKPNIKPLSPIKNSERRKLADQIIADLGLEVPQPGPDVDPEDKAAQTAGLTSLRNSLLPDNSLSARITTTSGPDAKQVSGTVYVGAYPGEDQRILWVKLEDKMHPTVYTLWHNPGIVPLLHTPGFVVEKIQGGADLMTPGLQNGPPFPQKAKKGAVVAVASLESPTVPVTVGVCEIDVSALQQVQGARGHAVRTVHWAGDELWSWSAAGKAGGAPPEHLDGWYTGNAEVDAVTDQLHETGLKDGEDGGVQLDPAQRAEGADGEEASKEEKFDLAEDKDLTTKEIDEAFKKAFIYGVHQHMETNKNDSNYGLSFPLSQSSVMANLVQPFLPAFTPKQTASLQIKKTSFKNIKKFIKSLDKAQLVKSKDRDGNEVVILDIDFTDQTFKEFKPYRLPRKENAGGSSKANTVASGDDTSIGQKLKKVELFRPKEKLAPLFSSASADSRGLYTAAEIRPIITTYIESENLISPTNKRIVTLNPILANAVYDGSARSDKEVLVKGAVARDALVDRVLASCAPFYAITRNDEAVAAAKPKAGSAPKVTITLETRSGNKTVTKATGVEAYFINPQALADELRKLCASSTSVEKMVGSSPKNPIMEVMVQGPQKDAVLKALEKRGVPKGWIDVVDKTKKKK
ncbi:RNA binding protein ligatin tma64 [Neofusicoccum parvum]|uniref:RNA binding protein ligatin tma64 n=1 Tax=Neofusicoccum parvum TaxID=310453 RepID=A0ACB5S4U2_9PEZI|nr:RNA binding protein ligatin tma64 [Neofusicoccum parvum]GME61018.1 RNA binding protein ligatin tma64 [Neofusicoccum parvum]